MSSFGLWRACSQCYTCHRMLFLWRSIMWCDADYCQKITEKEALRAAGKVSDDESDVRPADDDDEFIHHPFAVREPTNMEITMRIRVRVSAFVSAVNTVSVDNTQCQHFGNEAIPQILAIVDVQYAPVLNRNCRLTFYIHYLPIRLTYLDHSSVNLYHFYLWKSKNPDW